MIKLHLPQVDVSEFSKLDISEGSTSEQQLYEYVDDITGAITTMYEGLHNMHADLKKYGSTLKMSKKANNNGVKEVTKTYNQAKKKADKVRNVYDVDNDELDQESLVALEREQANLNVYKFFLNNTSAKCFKKQVVGTYDYIQKALSYKPILKAKNGVSHLPKKVTKKSPKKVESQRTLPLTRQQTRIAELSEDEKADDNPTRVNVIDTSNTARFTPVKVYNRLEIGDVSDDSKPNTPEFIKSDKDQEDEEVVKEDQELLKILENDARNSIVHANLKSELDQDLKKSIRMESGAELKQRLSAVIGLDDESMTKFQNYITSMSE